jgi:hypothetical protein
MLVSPDEGVGVGEQKIERGSTRAAQGLLWRWVDYDEEGDVLYLSAVA